MKTLIIYGSRKGCTERCARRLMEEIILAGNSCCEVINAKQAKQQRVAQYEHVIIGSSIWAGKIHPAVRRFIIRYGKIPPAQRIGLFLCSGEEDPGYFTRNYPRAVIDQTKERRFFGGELIIENFNPLMKYLLRKKAGVTESYQRIRDDDIRAFARSWIAGGGQ